MQSRLTMDPDEHYRTEFPSHYYSNSSVYSYSPTSSSDCPEHGKSHRKAKIMLTLCVIFATLAVLSIAGVAAYLGFLSKSINNGSQYEESYLYSTAINRRLPSTVEDTHLFHPPNGRSRSDFFPPDPIDFTNRLEEPPHQPSDTPMPDDIDLNTKHINTIFYSQPNTSSILRNNYQSPLPVPRPSGIPSPVTISSHKLNPPPPIDLQSPLIILGPKRNTTGNRYIESRPTSPITVHFDQEDGTGIIHTKHHQPIIEQSQHHRKPILVRRPSIEDSAVSGETMTTTSTNENVIGTTILIGTIHEEDETMMDPVKYDVNRQGVPAISVPNPAETQKGSTETSLTSKSSSPQEEINSNPRPTDYNLIPVNPYYKPTPTEPSPSVDLISNHRVHLTFDRISPAFYDEKPWTPLMIHPSQILDKRPRVEDMIPMSSSPSPKPSQSSEDRLYAYGGTGGQNSNDKLLPPPPSSSVLDNEGHHDHNESDMHGGDGSTGHALEAMVHYPTGPNNFEEEEEVIENDKHIPGQYVDEDGNRQHIPTFTVSIPHISHPLNFSKFTNEDVTKGKEDIKEHPMHDGAGELEEIGDEAGSIEEYEGDEEEEEQNNKSQSEPETRIYALDPSNTDMVPPPIEIEEQKRKEAMLGLQKISNLTAIFEVEEQPETKDQSEVEQPENRTQSEVEQSETKDQSEIEQLKTRNQSEVEQPETRNQSEVEQPETRDQSEIEHSKTRDQSKVEQPETREQSEVEHPDTRDQSEVKQPETWYSSEVEQPKTRNQSEVEQPKIRDQSELVYPEIKDQLELEYPETKNQPEFEEPETKHELGENKETDQSEFEPNSTDAGLKATTDLILSSLGSLNLMKTPSPGDIPNEVHTNAFKQRNRTKIENTKSENPLFPPTRSYVSVNLPLRPKPTESESEETRDSGEKIFLVSGPEKKLRLVSGDGIPLAPDFTSSSSLNKVLSMMMTFDDSTKENPNKVIHLLKNNVDLVVANHSSTNSVHDGNVSSSLLTPPTKTREHKSFTRDPKIDSRFREPETQHIPVPLIPGNVSNPTTNQKTGLRHNENKTWVPTKLSSFTVNRHNSPVYKFILRKGQSVEDLLKEIFQNYTDKNIGKNQTEKIKVPESLTREETLANVIHSVSDVTNPPLLDLELTTTQGQSTKVPFTVSTVTTTTSNPTTPFPLTIDAGFRTSTSIVINEGLQATSMSNVTFRCTSTGVILSAFARCNSIKECPDNSDEKNCKCVDYLKSQLLHRKICDGIVDCADESDESYCDWCSPGQYICSGSRVCVSREKICDSRRDCPRGDDEANCVKIGPSEHADHLEDISPIYHQSGYLMVRKKGIWGKLCVETFSSVLTHWEVKDLARAVCKAKTFSDFETVEKVIDEEEQVDEPYYELYNGANDTASEERLYSSDESSPRSAIGFKVSKCKTRMVVRVRCQELQCGTAPRAFTQAARIVGGSNALPGEWPWQAALYRDGEYQCGATLISGRWLLSAGHCFYHAQDDYWVARLGTLRRGATILSPYEQVIKITHIFLHPQYKDIGFVNDVSLLRLEKEVNFTDFVRPVCLPGKETTIRDGRICTVVGWGQLFETGRVFPDTLQEVQLPLISTTECRKRTLFLPLYKLTDEMFCAGFDRGGRDACLGDSGGPLMCPESDGRWSLYGVTSNGYGCARANRPGVYTKTKSYLDWVYEKISQESSFTYRDKAKPCPGHRCLLGECLEPRSVCNGIADCVDSSDERNCTWS